MLNVRNILFPTDFSSGADRALRYAVYFARSQGAKLHMLHAQVLHSDDPGQIEHRFPDEGELGRIVEEVKGEHAGTGQGELPTVEHATRRGLAAAPAILEYTEENDIDLIVMGTHGRRGLRHLLVGSVAEEVVRMAPCPVVAIPERKGEQGFRPIRRIVAPTDFSEHAELGVTYATQLAEASGAEILLLHVVEEPVYPDFYMPYMAPPPVSDLQERASQELRKTIARVGSAEASAEVEVRRGMPALEIAGFAEEKESDLIVMSTHGLTGLEHLMLGSVTEKVIRHATLPVFVVKAFGKDLIDG